MTHSEIPDTEPLGPFRIISPLGKGGMGVVYRAQDERLGRLVALKVLPPQLLADPERRRRFLIEARSAAAVSHPNIAAVYEVGEHQGRVYIAMELVEGSSLRQVVASGPLAIDRALRIIAEISRALVRAHEAGVVHRDLKPENVMLGRDDEVKLVDFGLAKQLAPAPLSSPDPEGSADTVAGAMTREGQILGTPGYMAPEQALGQRIGPGADLFSLGVLSYEMLSGRAPFARETPLSTVIALSTAEPEWLSRVNPLVPEAVSRIVHGCLQKDPAKRYPSAAQLLSDLKRLAGDGFGFAVASSPEVPRPALARSRWGLGLFAALAFAGLAGVAALAWPGGPSRQPDLTRSREEPRSYAERRLTANAASNPLAERIGVGGGLLFYQDQDGLWSRALAAGVPQRVSTPKAVRRLQDAFPDGKRLLVSYERDRSTTGTNELGLEILEVATGALSPLPVAGEVVATVAPQGDRIAVWREQALEVIELDTGRAHPVTSWSASEHVAAFCWAPDGKSLAMVRAFASFQLEQQASIDTVAADGSGSRRLHSSNRLWLPGSRAAISWPEGDEILFVLAQARGGAGAELWSLRLRGGGAAGEPRLVQALPGTMVIDLRSTAAGLAVLAGTVQTDVYTASFADGGTRLRTPVRLTLSDYNERPSGWAGDGRVLFSSDRVGTWDVFAQAPGERSATSIAGGPAQETWPRPSFDGRVLFWRMEQEPSGALRNTELMRAELDGGAAVKLFGVALDRSVASAGRPPPAVIVRCARLAKRCAIAERVADELTWSWFDPESGRRDPPFRRQKLGQALDMLDWDLSADGTQLALVDMKQEISVLAVQGGEARLLRVPEETVVQYVAWSGDAQRLFVSGIRPGPIFVLGTIDLGGAWIDLHTSDHAWLAQPVVSPDGLQLAFAVQEYDSDLWLLAPR